MEYEVDNFNEQQVEDSEVIKNLLNQLTKDEFSTPLQPEIQQPEIPEVYQEQKHSIVELETTESATKSPEVVKSNPQKTKNSKLFSLTPARVLVPLISVMLSLGSICVFNNRQSQVNAQLPLPPNPGISYGYNTVRAVNYTANTTQEAQALAIQQFNENDIQAGKMAVEALLDRGAFVEAKNVIDAIPSRYSDNPNVNFLKGRLAWELFQEGNQNSVDEAISYWEKAVEQQPHMVLYQNALGFAYYTKGDIKTAYEAWLKVLHLSGEISPEAGTFRAIGYKNNQQNLSVNKREAMNAYAGLGLVMMKSGKGQEKHLNQALKYVRKVMTEAGKEFHIQQLQKNWLWSPKARQDWDLLLKQRTNRKSDEHNNSKNLNLTKIKPFIEVRASISTRPFKN